MKKRRAEDPLAPLKESIARELGLWEKVRTGGWGCLSAAESGRLGGLLYQRLRRGGPPVPSQQEEEREVDHQHRQSQGDAGARPVPAADAQLTRRDDVGDVAGDEHAS